MIINIGDRKRQTIKIATSHDHWEMGVMFMLFLLLTLAIVCWIKPNVTEAGINLIQSTVQQFEPWRVVLSFLIPGMTQWYRLNNSYMFFSCLEFAISLYFLTKVSRNVERKYSTAYFIINCFLQTIFNNAVLVIVYYPFIYFQLVKGSDIWAYGALPLTINFLFQNISINKDVSAKLLCFDCQFRYFYLLLLLMIIEICVSAGILRNPVLPLFIYIFLSYYQHSIRKHLFFKVPIQVYKAFDCIIPKKIFQSHRYTKVVNVQEELKPHCSKLCCKKSKKTQKKKRSSKQEAVEQKKQKEIKKNADISNNEIPQIEMESKHKMVSKKQRKNPKKYQQLHEQNEDANDRTNKSDWKKHWLQKSAENLQSWKNGDTQIPKDDSENHYEQKQEPQHQQQKYDQIIINQSQMMQSQIIKSPQSQKPTLDYRQFWRSKQQKDEEYQNKSSEEQQDKKVDKSKKIEEFNDDDFS